MKTKLLLLVALCCCVLADNKYHCTKLSALRLLKKPAYQFSVNLLQRVDIDTNSHFVFSPVSTWLQLVALSEGAEGNTFREIWNVTRHQRNKCFKKRLRDIIKTLKHDTKKESQSKGIFAIDRLLNVRKDFVKNVDSLYGIKVMPLDFNKKLSSASEVNHAMEEATEGEIKEVLYEDDFSRTVMLLSDVNYFYSAWQTPFISVYTKPEPFYSAHGVQIGEVNMMNQMGYFNMLKLDHIKAEVLELPFANPRLSMLVFLPHRVISKGYAVWVSDLFYHLKKTTLKSVFKSYERYGKTLVNISIPKFTLQTEVDNLPELILDMGIKKMFNSAHAEFRRISKYPVYTSLMTQISRIDVNEKGVTASAESLAMNGTVTNFIANRPFMYMIVDKLTEFILYGGAYSKPQN